ncbi:DUF4097 family beta strand repeat-containing protein [Streptomyces cavernicola]|uniref:DUF4097 family beta strand repeat-containing protein n=1 Tax=Streptomyces cavernicola TaxID=3043613 RepID=A0ABT6SCF2_9ACTN|nr:DUF4097 family beta strand repeat-containing protein [Streptomyces sp. B-S-A6]MDI3405872.1 DUF4097 family beta strand repeat-containing protein [Streptomyces sp. B-S-A6]
MSVRTVRVRRTRTAAALGVALAAVVLVGGCASAADDDEPETRSFPLQGRTLTVDSDDSALDVVAADVEEVRVTRWFDGSTVLGEDPAVTWRMDGDTLQLQVDCDGFVSDCAARHRIEVPRAAAVHVVSKDGRVTASGFRTALRIRSDDGRVTVEDSSGPLELVSADGAVEALGVTSGRIDARSEDGRVRLDLGRAPDRVEAYSKGGAVSVDLPDGAYRVNATSADGSVDVGEGVERDERGARVVDVHSEDGSVSVN